MNPYEVKTGSPRDPAKMERLLCSPERWTVRCHEEGARRLEKLNQDKITALLLQAAGEIPNLLVPCGPPLSGEYSVRPPEPETGWFCAGELRGLQDFQAKSMTVPELWQGLSEFCDSLSKLFSLGIWGNADRNQLILRCPDGQSACGVCLTGIEYFQIYQSPQMFERLICEDENPATTAFRLLLGDAALCRDDRNSFLNRHSSVRSKLELQLGEKNTRQVREFFHACSPALPEVFLLSAQDLLSLSAGQLRFSALPAEIRLYLVLLGNDCCEESPALSAAVRAFYDALTALKALEYPLPPVRVMCVFPGDAVCLRRLEPQIIPSVTALNPRRAERPVYLGALLDCLKREIEEDVYNAIAPLVCYIALPYKKPLRCIDTTLMREMAQRQEAHMFESVFCSANMRNLDLGTQGAYRSLIPQNRVVTDRRSMHHEMFHALKNLLKMPRYTWRD